MKENESSCIQRYEGDRIFVRPENIISSEQGLFLALNGFETVMIPLIQGTMSGVFLERYSKSDFLIARKGSKGPCPNCDAPTNEKGICQNSNCFFRGMKVL